MNIWAKKAASSLVCILVLGGLALVSARVAKEKARNLDEFADLQRQILEGKAPMKVSFNCLEMNGYGNRLYAMLTAFLIAVLDDRFLVISRWHIISDFIEAPFEHTFNNSLPKELSAFYKFDEIINYHVFDVTFTTLKDVNLLIQTKLPNSTIKRVKMCGVDPHFFPLSSNPLYYDKLYKYGLVEKATIDDARLKLNQPNKYSSDERLEAVLRIGFQVGGNLLNKHWLPRPIIKTQIDYYVENFFKGNYVIGLQLRTSYMNEQSLQRFLDCAKDIESVAENLNIKWFVTTDSQALLDELRVTYGHKMIMVNGTIGHVYESPDVHLVYEKTILDNELLSLCDEIVITGGSTYGFVAAMKVISVCVHDFKTTTITTIQQH